MDDAAREALIADIERRILSCVLIRTSDGGYNCCGCATYRQIVEDTILLIRGGEPTAFAEVRRRHPELLEEEDEA